ncbi:MAG TPA: serine/threonine-protein kinase [Kofleriaceae bacterium]|jgi:serine/threonine-protein kinase|nr:serine/threonine-protein kinase [Kofleriaceae bacterium]
MRERFGSYEIYEELGAGGLAAVHLARSRAIKNPVALKRLYPQIASIRELVGSFIDEARLARHLRHPGIARVYEFGKLRGTYFIAFEFVPGPTLQQLQQHCMDYVGKIPTMVVLEIAYQLCDALEHAHNLRNELGHPLGIVHRDVSPSNVIVSNTGQVKLIDFGLAKTKQNSVQSQVGVIKGKLNYVAPEYLSGKLDARCDLWALGVVMYELLTGKRLFDAPEQGTILDHVRSLPIPPPSRANPEVPPEVDQIVLTALTRDPNKRWQRAGDMRDAIGVVAAGRLTAHQLVSWVEWVFSQKQPLRREDSAVSALYEIIQSKEVEVVGDLPAISGAMLERRRESVAMMPTLAATMIRRRTRARWAWGAALLGLGGAGLLAHWLGAL